MDALKLDLGCGRVKRKGFIRVDLFNYPGVDVVMNLDKKWKFKDNSIDEIYTSHTLEHVENLSFVMEEIWRVGKPSTKVIIKVPHFSGKSGFFEFHKRFFRYDSFGELQQTGKEMKVSNKFNFKIIRKRLIFLKKWYLPLNYIIEPIINLHPKLCLFYEETFWRNLFPAYELFFELGVLK